MPLWRLSGHALKSRLTIVSQAEHLNFAIVFLSYYKITSANTLTGFHGFTFTYDKAANRTTVFVVRVGFLIHRSILPYQTADRILPTPDIIGTGQLPHRLCTVQLDMAVSRLPVPDIDSLLSAWMHPTLAQDIFVINIILFTVAFLLFRSEVIQGDK